jgi:glucan phosphoethanolaminetransferase (alkaline phosphatase superfamily)
MTPPPPSIRPHGNPVVTPVPVSGTGRYQDNRVDVKLVLSGMWIAMLFVSAYVDIFAYFRKDVLRAALDGHLSGMTQPVDQTILTAALLYILVPSLMIVLSLILRPRANRVTNMAVSLLYAVTVAVSCIGETWVYDLLGSAVEVVLLLAIARTARKWPRQPLAS